MKDYLKNRIKELREADAKFCDDRWDMSKHQLVRAMARENSNSVTLARQELERALDVFNKLNIHSVVGQSEQLPFDFIKWYSGMSEQKILNAYKRWQKEKG